MPFISKIGTMAMRSDPSSGLYLIEVFCTCCAKGAVRVRHVEDQPTAFLVVHRLPAERVRLAATAAATDGDIFPRAGSPPEASD